MMLNTRTVVSFLLATSRNKEWPKERALSLAKEITAKQNGSRESVELDLERHWRRYIILSSYDLIRDEAELTFSGRN